MKANPVGWFEIYVQDMGRARKFYDAVLAVKLERLPGPDIEMFAFPMQPEAPGSGGALVYMKGFPPGSGNTIVYFNCDDCAVEEARVVPAGGKIYRSKLSIGQYGFISLVYDTEGTLIGLYSRK
jgi:predicted enzyme related to lactoylglutathione lyase